MKVLIDIPEEMYDKICLATECGMGSFAFRYIADGEVIEDEEQTPHTSL